MLSISWHGDGAAGDMAADADADSDSSDSTDAASDSTSTETAGLVGDETQEVTVPVVEQEVRTGLFGHRTWDQFFWTVLHGVILYFLCMASNGRMVTVNRRTMVINVKEQEWLQQTMDDDFSLSEVRGINITTS